MKVISSAVIIFATLGLFGCSDDSDFAEGIGASGEVEDLRLSSNTAAVGDLVTAEVDVDTTDFFGLGDVYVILRFSPQLRYVSGSATFYIGGILDTDDPFQSGESQSGDLDPVCSGSSIDRGDRYVGFMLDGNWFSEAANNRAEIRLQLQAAAPTPQAFVTATARDRLNELSCETLAPEPEAAADIAIAGR